MKKSLGARFALMLIRFYKNCISVYTPPTCKYIPTCSTYAYQAIEKYGFFKGGLKAAWRVLRCNPFSKGGYDPLE